VGGCGCTNDEVGRIKDVVSVPSTRLVVPENNDGERARVKTPNGVWVALYVKNDAWQR
jgi:hypothetical protein